MKQHNPVGEQSNQITSKMHNGSMITLSQPDNSKLKIEDGNENAINKQAPTNTFGGNSQKGSDRAGVSAQMGSISESNSQSDYSDEENEDIEELDSHKKENIGKDKKRSQSVLNDLKLGGQNFVVGGVLRKQPTMIHPTLKPQVQTMMQSPMRLAIPKSRFQMHEESKLGSSGGTRGGSNSPAGSPSPSRTPDANDGRIEWTMVKNNMAKKASTQ